MSQDQLSRVANAAAGALHFANYPRESADWVAAERLRALLGSRFLPYLLGVCEEMERLSREHVLDGVLPLHALAQDAIEELAEK